MTLRHSSATVPRGMHDSLGSSRVRGGGATGSAAVTLEADRADAWVKLAPSGTYAGGQFAERVDTSAWTAFAIIARTYGAPGAATTHDFGIATNQANAVVFQDTSGNDYVRIQTTTATPRVWFGSTALSPAYVFLGTGAIQGEDGDTGNEAGYALNVRGGDGFGSDVAGGALRFTGGRPRGNGAGGSVVIATAPAGSSGGTLQAAIDRVTVDQNGDVTENPRSNGQALGFPRSLTELHTLALAATSDTTIQIPANALVLFVSIRITTTITGCATLDYGVAGDATRFGTGLALTAGTTHPGPDSGGFARYYPTATAIRFSAIGGGGAFTAGVVRVTIHYLDCTPPTS